MSDDDQVEALLPQLYGQMHARGEFLGGSWRTHLPALKALLAAHPAARVMDFGCGPAGGLTKARLEGTAVVPFDPYVAEYAEDPWDKRCDAFFSCDVFEHLTLTTLHDLCRRLIKHKTFKWAFVALTARAANKTFPDGRNCHLTVRPPHWWQGFFEAIMGRAFTLEGAAADLATQECRFVFLRKAGEG